MAKMVIGGAIGGLIGAAVWAAIGYFTGYEIGWIAWGVGLLAGIGVRAAGSQETSYYDREQKRMVTASVAPEGSTAGVIAAVAAVGSVVLGKYAVIHLLFATPAASFAELSTDEVMIASIADEIAYEQESNGRTVNWPAGMDYESAAEPQDYPPEIWAQALVRWEGMPDADKEAFRQQTAEMFGLVLETVDGAKREVFMGSFGPFDLLWLGLAALTAFRVGSATEQ